MQRHREQHRIAGRLTKSLLYLCGQHVDGMVIDHCQVVVASKRAQNELTLLWYSQAGQLITRWADTRRKDRAQYSEISADDKDPSATIRRDLYSKLVAQS
ncbi:hypothetical protein CDG81_13465 [Actinopolyspora erythraea]|uniref:Uncharacterized protein n=1 Tax=Actinopolyspora erythraea TaxID=414996 RepID=A0A099D5I2_9ACTN|nr:hypothetical protein CDG81_13465 [Actinopolyspora erythraea]KGI80595.1 hypothetical protein IL38_16330 [Actinopolyspora erythraea]